MPAGILTRGPAARLALPAAGLCLLFVSLGVHLFKYPDFSGFWAGVDQQRYLESARAWAAFDLSPAKHHYLPLYPLLGAAFVWLTPWQPFMLPDAACWVASLLIFVRIGKRLVPDWPAAIPAACFLVAGLGGRTLVAIWVVPWSTTGSAPWQFAAILLALRLGERPSAGRAAALGAAIAVVAGFRPSDAAVLLAGTGLYVATMVRRGAILPLVSAAGAGFCAGLLPAAVAHLAVFGVSPGSYISESADIGFEWRLLALRWVLLVVDPRPLLPEGRGLAEALPWIVPGIAGALLAVCRPEPTRRTPARLAALVMGLHWAVYLSYRDMHPYGLWRFFNVHYFKWTFPFLVLWAAELAAALVRPLERARGAWAVLATLGLFAWRPILDHPVRVPVVLSTRTIAIPDGLPGLSRATRLPLIGEWPTLYLGAFTLHVGARDFVSKRDFKLLPIPGGALLVPLRPLPAGTAVLELAPGVSVAAGPTPTSFRQSIVFGLPFGIWRPSCQ